MYRVIFVVAVLVVLALAVDTGQPALAQDGSTVLITGSNRNIGLAFAQGYAKRGWNVIATCRTPEIANELKELAAEYDNVVIEELDVTDSAEIDALAEKYKDTAIDVLLGNAGINPFRSGDPSRFGSINYKRFDEILKVNVIGATRVSEAFLSHVEASSGKKIVVMTSTGGSIGGAQFTGGVDYRASKAAINMIMHLYAMELKERGVIVGIIGPGSVDTAGYLDADPETLPKNIQRLLASGRENMVRADEAIGSMIELIDGLTLETSGKFYDWEGTELPW
jgi:NAD(P)-dependent dehydrogenase (short-subunit alcohol dehydrogenase family)